MLRQLPMFAGGRTLEAPEAVCGSEDVEVLDAVCSPVDKCLLPQRGQPDGTGSNCD